MSPNSDGSRRAELSRSKSQTTKDMGTETGLPASAEGAMPYPELRSRPLRPEPDPISGEVGLDAVPLGPEELEPLPGFGSPDLVKLLSFGIEVEVPQ